MSLFEQQDDWFFSRLAKEQPSGLFGANPIVAEELSPGMRTLDEEWQRAKEWADNLFRERGETPDDKKLGRTIAAKMEAALFGALSVPTRALDEIATSLGNTEREIRTILESTPRGDTEEAERARMTQAAIDVGFIARRPGDGGDGIAVGNGEGSAYETLMQAEFAADRLEAEIRRITEAYNAVREPVELDGLDGDLSGLREQIGEFKTLLATIASKTGTFDIKDLQRLVLQMKQTVNGADAKIRAADAALATNIGDIHNQLYGEALEHHVSGARTASEAYDRAREAYIRDLVNKGFSAASARAGMEVAYDSGLWDDAWKDEVARRRAAESSARIFDRTPEARAIYETHRKTVREHPEAATETHRRATEIREWIASLGDSELNAHRKRLDDLAGIMRGAGEGRRREGVFDGAARSEIADIRRRMKEPGADIPALTARLREVYAGVVTRATDKVEEMMRLQGVSEEVIAYARSRGFEPLTSEEYIRLSRIPDDKITPEQRIAREFHENMRVASHYRGLANETGAIMDIVVAKNLEPAIERARSVMLDPTKSLTERVEALEVALGSTEKSREFASTLNDDSRIRAVYMDAMTRAERRAKSGENYTTALSDELSVLRDPEVMKRRMEDRSILRAYDAEVTRELARYRSVDDQARALSTDPELGSSMSTYLSASMGVLHPEVRSAIQNYQAGTITAADLKSKLEGQHLQQAIIDGATLKRAVLTQFEMAAPDKHKLLLAYLEKMGVDPKDDRALARLDVRNLPGMPDPAKRSEWTPEETALAQFAAYSGGAARMLEVARGIAQDAKNGSYLIDQIYHPDLEVKIPGTNQIDMRATVDNRIALLDKFKLLPSAHDRELVGRLLQLDKEKATELLGRLAKAADMPGGGEKERIFQGVMLDAYIAMRPAHERVELEKARMEAGVDPDKMRALTSRIASSIQFESDTMMQIQQQMRIAASAAVYSDQDVAPRRGIDNKPEQVATWELSRLEAYRDAYRAQVNGLPARLKAMYAADKEKYAFLKPIIEENEAVFKANRRPGLIVDKEAARLADEATLRRIGFVAGSDDAVVKAIEAEIAKKKGELEQIQRDAAAAVYAATPMIPGRSPLDLRGRDKVRDEFEVPALDSSEIMNARIEGEARELMASSYLKDVQGVVRGGRTEFRDGARAHFITLEQIRIGNADRNLTEEQKLARATAAVDKVMRELEGSGATSITAAEMNERLKAADTGAAAPLSELPALPDAHAAWIRQRVKGSKAELDAMLAQARIPPMPNVISAAIASETAIKAVQERAKGDAVARPPLTTEQLLQSAQFKVTTLGAAADKQVQALTEMMKLPPERAAEFKRALSTGDAAALEPFRAQLAGVMKTSGELLAANGLTAADTIAHNQIAQELIKSAAAATREMAAARVEQEGRAAQVALERDPAKLTLALRDDKSFAEGPERAAQLKSRDEARELVMKAREQSIRDKMAEMARAAPAVPAADQAAQFEQQRKQAVAAVDRELAERAAKAQAPVKDGQPVAVDARALVAAQDRLREVVQEQADKKPDARYHKPAMPSAEEHALKEIRQRVAAMDSETILAARAAAARIRKDVHLYQDPLSGDRARDVELARQLAFKEAADAKLAQGTERSPGARVEYSVALAAGRDAERSVEQSIRGRNAIIAVEQRPELKDFAQRDQSRLRGPELQRAQDAAALVRLAEQQREIMLQAKLRELEAAPGGRDIPRDQLQQQARLAVETEVKAMVAKASTGGAVVSMAGPVRGVEFAALMPAGAANDALGKSAEQRAREEEERRKEAERRKEQAKVEEQRAKEVAEKSKEAATVVANAHRPEPEKKPDPARGSDAGRPVAGRPTVAEPAPRLAVATLPGPKLVDRAPDLARPREVVPREGAPTLHRVSDPGPDRGAAPDLPTGGVLGRLAASVPKPDCGVLPCGEVKPDEARVASVPDARVRDGAGVVRS